MAKEAYRILESGKEVPCLASTLSHLEKDSDFWCNGTDDKNRQCRAMMSLCLRKDGNHYFRVIGNHIPRCSNSRSSDTSRKYHIDKTGKGFDIADLLSFVMKKRRPTYKANGGVKGDNPRYKPDDDPKKKPIERAKRNPNKLSELYNILCDRPNDYIFGKKKVEDLIFNKYTHESHRGKGLHGILLVVACKIIPKNKPDNNQLYLADPFLITNDRLQFLLNFRDRKIRDDFLDSLCRVPQESQFLVLGDWGPCPDQLNTYIATIHRSAQIEVLSNLDD